MANTTNTTNTDKSNFKVAIFDKTRYDTLSNDDKEIFELTRNSILEIFPLNDKNIYDELCLQFAENFAFIQLNMLNKFMDLKIQIKLTELEQKINNSQSTNTTSVV